MSPVLLPNSFRQRIPFGRGENLVDDDNDREAIGYSRNILNYSIDSARRLKLRGGRQKISQRIENVRFTSPMEYTSTAIPAVHEIFWGTNAGTIYKHDTSGKTLSVQAGVTFTPNTILRPINYNGKLLFCNGVDTERQYNGVIWSNLSTGLSERFIDWVVTMNRIYAISATRLYWCAINDETNWTAGAGENDANSRVVQTSFPTLEGDALVSVAAIGQFVIVFGRNSMVVYQVSIDQRVNAPFKPVPGVGIVHTRTYVNAGSLFFWSPTEGWREFLEAITGETIQLEQKSPIRKNKPRLSDRLAFLRGANLLDGIHCGLQARESRLIMMYPRKADGTGTEFYIYNFSEDVGGWFRWTGHPVFSFHVDQNGDILGGGEEYIYAIDTDTDDDGKNINAFFDTMYMFGNDPREKVWHTLNVTMENKGDVNIGYEPELDYGTRDAPKITKDTLVFQDSGYKYSETPNKPGVRFGEAKFSESLTNRRATSFGCEGAGQSYKQLFRYSGKSMHRFIDIELEGEIVI